ncbi:MAG: hypothetical protein IMW99_09975 [Firmicutes bacterium]|nr:hypothetical protein [Bacillota bacterium]
MHEGGAGQDGQEYSWSSGWPKDYRDPGDAGPLAVVSGATRIVFSCGDGRLVSLTDPRFQGDLLKFGAISAEPFRIVALDDAHHRCELVPAQVAGIQQEPGPAAGRAGSRPGCGALFFRHAGCRVAQGSAVPAGLAVPADSDASAEFLVPVEVNWSVRAGGPGEFLWRIRLHNHTTSLRLVEVVFPLLKGLSLGPDYRDDVLVYPHHAGELTVNPVREYSSPRFEGFSRAASVRQGGQWVREIPYCGLASMQWLDYFDPAGGLYFASHDKEFGLTGVIVYTGGEANPWLGFGFRKYVDVAAGGQWASEPFVLAVHNGDWREGARKYRAWIDPYLEIRPVAGDLALESALAPHYNFKTAKGISHRFRDIPKLFERARAEGIRHFMIAGWNRGGFDHDYPEYHPDMELGSCLDLERGCDYVESHGGMVTFYINARIFDTGSDFFKPLGEEWAAKDHTGAWTRESYGGPRVFAVMCPGAPGWRRHLVSTAVWLAKNYHARGIYLDQLGSATPLPCYDGSHGHAGIAGFNEGYVRLLEEVTQAVRQVRPDAFFLIENCGDLYSPYVYANLAWNGEFYDEFFDLYKYTFPEFVLVNMVNPRQIQDPAVGIPWFRRDLRRAMLLGSVFWIELSERFEGAYAPLLEELRLALRFREALAPYLAKARFVATDELPDVPTVWDREPDGPVTATNWILHNPPGRLVIAANGTGRAATLRLCLGAGCAGRRVTVRRLRLGGVWEEPQPHNVTSEGDLTFHLGPEPFAAFCVRWEE